jgi:hypothetical protein
LEYALQRYFKLLQNERHGDRSLGVLFKAEDPGAPIMELAVYELSRAIEGGAT